MQAPTPCHFDRSQLGAQTLRDGTPLHLQAPLSGLPAARREAQKGEAFLALFQPHHDVVNRANETHIAVAVALPPLLPPYVKHLRQSDDGRQRRDTRSLRTSRLTASGFAVLQPPAFHHFRMSRRMR